MFTHRRHGMNRSSATAVEIGVAGGYNRWSWPVRHDLILTPSYLVIRKWGTGGPGEVTVLERSDIQGIYLVRGRNSRSWTIQRYSGPSVTLPFAMMFGQPSSAYEPVLAALAADAERAGQLLVNRRDAVRLGRTPPQIARASEHPNVSTPAA